MPIGAGGIARFIAAELILSPVQVALETVGDAAGLLRMRVSAAQGHGVNKYGGRRSRGSGGYSRESCENESGELRERPEYSAEQRTCQLHRPSYCQWRLWRWLRVERSFSEAFMCRTFPFYTLSDREFVTEKHSTIRRMLRRSGCIIYSPTFNKVMISKGPLFLFYITRDVPSIIRNVGGKTVDTTMLSTPPSSRP